MTQIKDRSFIGWNFTRNAIWNAQYQRSILHKIEIDTGMWNIVVVYIKDILRGELGVYAPFSAFSQIWRNWKSRVGEHPPFVKEEHFFWNIFFVNRRNFLLLLETSLQFWEPTTQLKNWKISQVCGTWVSRTNL